MLNRPKCLACGERYINRRGKLCWICYQEPGLRAKYPPAFDHRPRTIDGKVLGRLPTPDPSLVPGSEEKIEAMRKRAEAGEALFHPQEQKHTTATEPYEVPVVSVAERVA